MEIIILFIFTLLAVLFFQIYIGTVSLAEVPQEKLHLTTGDVKKKKIHNEYRNGNSIDKQL